MRKRSEYTRAVADSERESKFFVASALKATIPDYRVKLDRDIAELRIAWRDMSEEERAAMKKETILKAKSLMRPTIQKPDKAPGQTVYLNPIERDRQIESLYRAMTPEQRADYDGRKNTI